MSSTFARRTAAAALGFALAICGACAERGGGGSRSTDGAMKHPMNYSPKFDRKVGDGDGIGSFDKDGFNRDMKNAFDP